MLGRKESKTRGWFLLRQGDSRLAYETLQLRRSEELSHVNKGRKLSPANLFLKKFIYLFIYLFLFLAALGLHCCTRAFSSCSEN